MGRSEPIRGFAFLLALFSCGLLAFAGCHGRDHTVVRPSDETDAAFAGNEACKPCHASEFSTHHLSFHDTSMRTAACTALGKLLPDLGVIPLAGYAITKDGDGLDITRTSNEGEAKRKLDLVLGSGKLGMTYVSILPDEKLMETKMSYFPPYKVWDLTPGQEVRLASDTVFGREDSTDAARHCLGCHSTTLPARGHGIMPEPKFFGVGCEACHGPGRAHIDAVKSGHMADLKMPDLSKLPGSKLNELCGRCHRNAADLDLSSTEVNETHRFQPFALQRSACRTASNEPLSCVYCHDPHANVSTDLKKYEAVCTACHTAHTAPAGASGSPGGIDVRRAKVCPVNAASGCIGCHMRPKTAFPLTTIPAKMANHLITPPGAEQQRITPRLDTSMNSL